MSNQKRRQMISTATSSEFEKDDSALHRCLQKLAEQNCYLREALVTAQKLIELYQIENAKMHKEINEVSLLIKSKQSRNSVGAGLLPCQQTQRSKSRDRQLQYLEEINKKVHQMSHCQQAYQSKVDHMQEQIKNLTRSRSNFSSASTLKNIKAREPSPVNLKQLEDGFWTCRPKNITQLRLQHESSKTTKFLGDGLTASHTNSGDSCLSKNNSFKSAN